MMLGDFVCQADLIVSDRQAQRRDPDRFRGGLQVVSSRSITPRHHKLAVPNDVARTAAGERVFARPFE